MDPWWRGVRWETLTWRETALHGTRWETSDRLGFETCELSELEGSAAARRGCAPDGDRSVRTARKDARLVCRDAPDSRLMASEGRHATGLGALCELAFWWVGMGRWVGGDGWGWVGGDGWVGGYGSVGSSRLCFAFCSAAAVPSPETHREVIGAGDEELCTVETDAVRIIRVSLEARRLPPPLRA